MALEHIANLGDGTVANDRAFPTARLTLDSSGHLYGATVIGGSAGGGTVFKLDTSGNNYTVLHSFRDGTVLNDGADPYGDVILSPSGNLYGTTYQGGDAGVGTVFRLIFQVANNPPVAKCKIT